MKNKLNNFMKFGILLFGISLFLTSCQKDDIISDNISGHNDTEISNLKITTISNQALVENRVLSEKLLKIANKNTDSNKNLSFQNHGFVINTNNGKYLEQGDYHSYTFSISREIEENNTLENLLLSLQPDGSYKAFLLEYIVTEAQLIQIENNEELFQEIAISSIIELDDDFSGLFNKIIYQSDCVSLHQYEWHTFGDDTWPFYEGSVCNHLPGDPNGSCTISYTYDVYNNCTTGGGGGNQQDTGSSTYTPNQPNSGSTTTGNQNTTTMTPKCRTNCVLSLEQSTIINTVGVTEGSSTYNWLVNAATQQEIDELFNFSYGSYYTR